jgi:hypothetical protein
VLQFGADWQAKGTYETGHTGLISALAIDRAGNLHALDPQARKISSIDPGGVPFPGFARLPERGYGSMIVLDDGDFLIGEHLVGAVPGFSGDGKVYRVAADGSVLDTYDTETNGGMGGFLGVTHMALSADGMTLYHTSETGQHVYAHDLASNRRLGPVYTRADPPPMVFGIAMLDDGTLMLACGSELRRIDLQSGTASAVAMAEGRGWAVPVRRSADQLWALDFFGGRVALLDLADGTVAELHELGLGKCLTGIAEVPFP